MLVKTSILKCMGPNTLYKGQCLNSKTWLNSIVRFRYFKTSVVRSTISFITSFLQIKVAVNVTLITLITKQLNLPVKSFYLIFFTYICSITWHSYRLSHEFIRRLWEAWNIAMHLFITHRKLIGYIKSLHENLHIAIPLLRTY